MRSLSLLIVSSIFAVSTFAQNNQTVTLVFVTAASETYKNFEAVIDDVSYYSENTAGNNRTSNNRNTIWLNNFQPGQHTIQVYSLKNGSNEERSGNTPVYTSTFNVRQGFDTKIAVRNNGQVQFSERQGADNSNQNTTTNNNGDYNRNTKDGNGDYSNGNQNQNQNYNTKVAMSDDDFTLLKDNISKQWIPGSKMTALRNEFVTGGHYFTTIQAKELIEFVTDENNRLELAKASYPIITDQDNFRQVYDLFRSQSSKDEMDRFIRNSQNQN